MGQFLRPSIKSLICYGYRNSHSPMSTNRKLFVYQGNSRRSRGISYNLFQQKGRGKDGFWGQ